MEDDRVNMDALDDVPHNGNDAPSMDGNGSLIGSAAMRPVFLGNLSNNYTAADVTELFERPIVPPDHPERAYSPIPVDRVDLKRGYCFVFLKDAVSEEDKAKAERFVSDINGMAVPNVTNSLRAEFARGDGRVKRKEDDRRRRIQPCDTLFVVNFHEETTKREDLQMLFEPFGDIVRIEMKRNYAFVQFRTVDEATRAKEVTNGGKLDQSVLTVEFVARQRGDGGPGGGGGDRRRDRDRDRRNDRRGPPPMGRGPPPPDYGRRRDDRYDDVRRRPSPPPRDRYDADYRRRSRSRSRSPRYRSRSPPPAPPRRDYYDDRDSDRRGHSDGYRARSPDGYRGRGRSADDREYRGDRDRGYRA